MSHLMNRIESKNQKAGKYKINKIYLSGFDDKTYILKNVYDGLSLGYSHRLWDKSFFNNYSECFSQVIKMWC